VGNLIAAERIATILIVDDSMTARMIVRRCLEIAGFRDVGYLEANNGCAAWQLLQQRPVDLVLTDLNMPGWDGRRLLEKIKADPLTAETWVIVVTSSSNRVGDWELIKAGADAVLSKPVSPAKVYQVLLTLKLVKGRADG
jgi:two-component system chemotaxis response regulator CheY